MAPALAGGCPTGPNPRQPPRCSKFGDKLRNDPRQNRQLPSSRMAAPAGRQSASCVSRSTDGSRARESREDRARARGRLWGEWRGERARHGPRLRGEWRASGRCATRRVSAPSCAWLWATAQRRFSAVERRPSPTCDVVELEEKRDTHSAVRQTTRTNTDPDRAHTPRRQGSRNVPRALAVPSSERPGGGSASVGSTFAASVARGSKRRRGFRPTASAAFSAAR